MKRYIRLLSLALALCILFTSLAACSKNKSGKNKPYDKQYDAYDRTGEPYDYYLPDYIDLCEYKGIELPYINYVPSQQDINNRLKQLAGYYSERTEDPDRACRKYDYVDIITTCKFKDTGEDYQLFTFTKNDNDIGQTFLLGINFFGFPELDETIVGMKAGETKKVTLTLPDPFYRDFINSGKEVEMEIYLNYIDEVDFSGIDDQFYHDHYGYYGDGLNEYIIQELVKEFSEYLDGYEVALAWNYICENSKLIEVPEKEYKEVYDDMLNSARSAAQSKKLTLLEYVKEQYGYNTLEEYYNYLEDYTTNYCYEEMLLYYILRRENLTYTEEFRDECLLSMVEAYDITDLAEAEDFLLNYMGADNLHESILMQYVQYWITEQAVIRDDVTQVYSDKLNKK